VLGGPELIGWGRGQLEKVRRRRDRRGEGRRCGVDRSFPATYKTRKILTGKDDST